MCNPTEGVPNVPFAGDCCQKSLTSQSMCKCGHKFMSHEGWSENHFSNCVHVNCGCTKFQPALEVEQAIQSGRSLEAVKQVLKRMPDSLQRDADYWIGRALEELFAQYPRSETEAVKAERARIINTLTPYLAHKHVETPINKKTYGGSTYYDSSDCEVCKLIEKLRSGK